MFKTTAYLKAGERYWITAELEKKLNMISFFQQAAGD